jgi:hypothetical protein
MELRLEKSRRELVMILDEEQKEAETWKKENLRAVFEKMRGVEMFRGIGNVRDWQKIK